MKRDEWKVGEYGIRPNGSPDHCFYCGEPRGADHKPDCVIRSRTVVAQVTIEYVHTVPEFWTQDEIEFFLCDSSWCASNVLDELRQIADRGGCLCGQSAFEYLREATTEDEERDGIKVTELPS